MRDYRNAVVQHETALKELAKVLAKTNLSTNEIVSSIAASSIAEKHAAIVKQITYAKIDIASEHSSLFEYIYSLINRTDVDKSCVSAAFFMENLDAIDVVLASIEESES